MELKIETKFNKAIINVSIIEPYSGKIIFERTLNLMDEQIIKALIKLGWTPPKDKINGTN
jgi:hypothetical protein